MPLSQLLYFCQVFYAIPEEWVSFVVWVSKVLLQEGYDKYQHCPNTASPTAQPKKEGIPNPQAICASGILSVQRQQPLWGKPLLSCYPDFFHAHSLLFSPSSLSFILSRMLTVPPASMQSIPSRASTIACS